MTSTVLLAPDGFKGTITAADACAALAEGWRSVDPDARLLSRPMADGGEGTVEAFAAAVPGSRRMPVTVSGPLGEPVDTTWLLLPATDDAPGGTAVVDLASTAGIERLPGPPTSEGGEDASTRGFGQAVAAALDHGVSRLVLGIGSSASTDGGAGFLQALGARLHDERGDALAPGVRGLTDVARADVSALRPVPDGGVLVLSDVVNPLVGRDGAAAVFGPQKGLDPAAVAGADAALRRYARVLARALPTADPTVPGAGAAGGTGFALQAWGAVLDSGAARIADLVGIPAALREASVVVTGEGSYDGQSAAGKAPAHITRLAAAAGVPVVLVAGRITADTGPFAAHVSLTDLAGGAQAAVADPARWLREAGARLARTWSPRASR